LGQSLGNCCQFNLSRRHLAGSRTLASRISFRAFSSV
jgi:hypothetical protein